MFAPANQLTLHYQEEGQPQGAPLVFLHSLGTDLRIWDEATGAFTGRFRILRYDLRGHGLSDSPPGPYAIHEESSDLLALLSWLGIREAILIGISVGGLIAMDFALRFPDAARGLALADTAPKIGTAEGWNERIRAVRDSGLGGMAETILSRSFLPSFPQDRPVEYRGYVNMLSRSPVDGYNATCAALRDTDLSGGIQKIAVPVLALCGAGDPVVTPEQTREWAGRLPQARVEVIDGAAHLPCIEQPQATAAAIARFLVEDCHAG